MTVCAGWVEFFLSQRWIPYVMLVLAVFVAIVIILAYIRGFLANITDLRSSLEQSEEMLDSLKKRIELSNRVKERHLIHSVLPAMHKLLHAIKKSKEGVIPSDQAMAFLKTLTALWGDDLLFLDKVTLELLKCKGDALKPCEEDLFFQLFWTADSSKGSVSFFLNWKGLATPFSWTVWL